MEKEQIRPAGRVALHSLPLVFVIFCLVFLGAESASAEPKPFPEFTFKTVKPPKPGQKPKVDVQIPLVEQGEAARAAQTAVTTKPEVPAALYTWFWEVISPALDQAGAGRIEQAVNALRGPKGQIVPTPRLAEMQALADRYAQPIMIETIGTGVSPALVLSVIHVESSGDPKAESGAGAQGLMQLMPDTADRFGVSDSFDAEQNIRGGVAYLSFLLAKFGGDPMLALAGYNAGENAVVRASGVPDYQETRDYVPKVLAAYTVATALCQSPPTLVSDGCALRTSQK